LLFEPVNGLTCLNLIEAYEKEISVIRSYQNNFNIQLKLDDEN